MLEVKAFVCGPLENNVYLLVHGGSRQCAVVDPGMQSEAVLDHIAQHELAVKLVLNTHAHFDHTFMNAEFVKRFNAPLALHPADLPLLQRLADSAANWGFAGATPSPEPDILLEHGQTLELAGVPIEVRHTPGHSPGQVAFIASGSALVGDTLFWRGVGRWDLPGGDFETLERSVLEQLYTLPPETKVYPGHGAFTTIGDERRLNPYIGDGARFDPKL